MEALELLLLDELGQGSSQVFCFVLARLPNFFGFSPSSLAIWLWTSERRKRFLASIHGSYFAGIFLPAISHLFRKESSNAPTMPGPTLFTAGLTDATWLSPGPSIR